MDKKGVIKQLETKLQDGQNYDKEAFINIMREMIQAVSNQENDVQRRLYIQMRMKELKKESYKGDYEQRATNDWTKHKKVLKKNI